MFAIMRSLLFCISGLLTLLACVDTPNGNGPIPATDTAWEGEVRMTAGDTLIRVCGSGRVYKLTGPAMDTITYRYVHARMNTGQWMKVWCLGHLGSVMHKGLVDSALFAVTYQHLDASLQCDPIVDPRIAGDWKLDELDPKHPRDVHLHLYEDGVALMITDLHSDRLPLEEDGTWGTDVGNMVNVNWPMRQQTMRFTWDGATLVNTERIPGKSATLRHMGPPDPAAGAFGRAARWLATTATAQGRPTAPEDLRPTTPIADLFPSTHAIDALRAQARDTFATRADNATLGLDGLNTVRDFAVLLRTTPRR